MNLQGAITTVSFVDQYCAAYQDLFPEVRDYECFKFLHLGMISELKIFTSDRQSCWIVKSQPYTIF